MSMILAVLMLEQLALPAQGWLFQVFSRAASAQLPSAKPCKQAKH